VLIVGRDSEPVQYTVTCGDGDGIGVPSSTAKLRSPEHWVFLHKGTQTLTGFVITPLSTGNLLDSSTPKFKQASGREFWGSLGLTVQTFRKLGVSAQRDEKVHRNCPKDRHLGSVWQSPPVRRRFTPTRRGQLPFQPQNDVSLGTSAIRRNVTCHALLCRECWENAGLPLAESHCRQNDDTAAEVADTSASSCRTELASVCPTSASNRTGKVHSV